MGGLGCWCMYVHGECVCRCVTVRVHVCVTVRVHVCKSTFTLASCIFLLSADCKVVNTGKRLFSCKR